MDAYIYIHICELKKNVTQTYLSYLFDVIDPGEHPDSPVVKDGKFLCQLLLARLQCPPWHFTCSRCSSNQNVSCIFAVQCWYRINTCCNKNRVIVLQFVHLRKTSRLTNPPHGLPVFPFSLPRCCPRSERGCSLQHDSVHVTQFRSYFPYHCDRG